MMLESLQADDERVEPAFSIGLCSLEGGDFEAKELAITFLLVLLQKFERFAQANFKQLFVGICEIASAMRAAHDPAYFDETVAGIFFEAWDYFLTHLRSLAVGMGPRCMEDEEMATACTGVPPHRDFMATDETADPSDWVIAFYLGVDTTSGSDTEDTATDSDTEDTATDSDTGDTATDSDRRGLDEMIIPALAAFVHDQQSPM
jgi:hypothetical protein